MNNLMITKAMKIVLLLEISDQILRSGMMYVALNVSSLFVKFFQVNGGIYWDIVYRKIVYLRQFTYKVKKTHQKKKKTK